MGSYDNSLPFRLTTIEQRRAKNGPLPGGIAPQVSSDLYRNASAIRSKNKSRDWTHRLSEESRSRGAATLKATASPGGVTAINLGTARPASEYFPWQSMTLEAIDARHAERLLGHLPTASMSCVAGEEGWDLGIAMNYGQASGSPHLLRYLTEHVELVHEPAYADWEVCLTSGTTAALEMVFRMFCNRGDWILTEAYTYAGATEALKPLGVKALGIEMDELGLLPEDLDRQLREWDTTKGSRPFVLYTIPSGQNPTSSTHSRERRRAIYQIAEQYDLIIVEDDPYFFLHLESSSGRPLSPDQYLDSLVPSYLSLDQSGRVLRLDATSKILAPGLRLGWITGCSQLIAKIKYHTDVTTTAPSGPSQVMLYKLLDETWGHEGFLNWLSSLSFRYQQCRDTMAAACEKYLPADICHWTVPSVGMFLWVRIDIEDVKRSRGMHETATEIEEQIYKEARANGVSVSRGSWFSVSEKPKRDEIFIRMTFAAASRNTLDEAVRRFATALRSVLKLETLPI